jgi:hypothetical protein
LLNCEEKKNNEREKRGEKVRVEKKLYRLFDCSRSTERERERE